VRIELRVSGGVTGVRRPPIVIDTADLDPASAAELEQLVAATELGDAPAGPAGPDRFQYDLTIDGRHATLYEGSLSPAAEGLIARVRELARER
jgi:hypothetical protein